MKKWKLPDGTIISRPKPVKVGNVQHPKEIFTRWSDDELRAIGIYPFEHVEREYNPEFYKSGGENIVGSPEEGQVTVEHVLVPSMAIEDLKFRKIKEVKKMAFILLSPYDWQYTRKVRTGEAPEPSVDAYCKSVVTASDAIEGKIDAFGVYQDLIDFNWNDRWPDPLE